MVWKNILIVFILSLVVFSSRSALAQIEDVATGDPETGLSSVENIGNTIKEKTPNFVVRPLIYVAERVDGLREKIKIIIEARKTQTEEELGELNASPAPAGESAETEDSTSKTEFFKAFKHLEVFVLILMLFIFSIKFLYYGFMTLLILIILRFFWLRIY